MTATGRERLYRDRLPGDGTSGSRLAFSRLEVGSPGDFSKLGSQQAIVQKLEERAGPEARKLFEKFMRDVEKLAQQEHKDG